MAPPLKHDSSTNDKPYQGPLPVGRLPVTVKGNRQLTNTEFKTMQKELQIAALQDALDAKQREYTDWCKKECEPGYLILDSDSGMQTPFSPTESDSGSMSHQSLHIRLRHAPPRHPAARRQAQTVETRRRSA